MKKQKKVTRLKPRKDLEVEVHQSWKPRLVGNGHSPPEEEDPSGEELAKTATPSPEEETTPEKPEVEVPQPKERQLRSQDNAYTLYLREIGQSKLLTPQEEIVLAKRIHKGDEAARETMIKANLRLVVKIARDYEEY